MSTFTRRDFEALTRTRNTDKVNGQKAQIQAVIQASVSAANLTGHPDWDRFLSQIQAVTDTFRNQREGFRVRAEDPELSMETANSLRIQIIRLNAMLEFAEAVMSFPRQLIAEGDAARTLLDKYGGPDTD